MFGHDVFNKNAVDAFRLLKMFCTSCEICKLRYEDLYRNLDDEKKHFLVLMKGDFRDEMIIPEEIRLRLKGKIPGEIQLETRIGYSHTIVVAKNQENLVLTVGWKQFTESYDLRMGDSFMFSFSGSSQINVIIFDNLGREKALSSVLDPIMTQVQDRRSDAYKIGSARNMDGPCVMCINWLDYYYMNSDDEKKHFLVLMIGDFTHQMIITEEIVNRFKGGIPGEIILETQNRSTYKIGVANYQEKLVLTVGWGNFVKTLGLQMGDAIVFRYNGNSKFSVFIFDNLGRENALSVVVVPFLAPVQERLTNAIETVNCSNSNRQPVQMHLNIEAVNREIQIQSAVEFMSDSQVRPQPMEIQLSTSRMNGPPMESPPIERQRRFQMDKSCQGNVTPINIPSSESSEHCFSSEDDRVPRSNYPSRKKNVLSSSQREKFKDGYITVNKTKLSSAQKEAVKPKANLKDGYITMRKTKLTLVQKVTVKQKVQSIHSAVPILVAVMRKCSVASGGFLDFPRDYVTEYLGREANMYLQRLREKYPVRLDNDTRLKSGWRRFVKDNDLKTSDICLFEPLSTQSRRKTIEVYIIRANDEN